MRVGTCVPTSRPQHHTSPMVLSAHFDRPLVSISTEFQESLRLAKTYWIVYPKATAKLPKIIAFTDWLLAEAAADIRQLQKLKSMTPPKRRAE